MDLTFSISDTQTFKRGEEQIGIWQNQFPRDFILSCLEHPVVAIHDETAVGLFECSFDYLENVMWLDSLWVHPEHRHKGYGSAILDYLVETCQYGRIKLFSANHSEPFYEKHGFKNTIGRYYEKAIDE